MKFKKPDKEGIFKSLFAAYFVILLHVFLLAGVGITVVLFRGVYNYLPWIMGGLAVLILALFWIFYLRMKKSSNDIKELLSFPEFRDRNVEIKLLGGFASFKMEGSRENLPPAHNLLSDSNQILSLEESTNTGSNSLIELADLYDRGLLTDEEFEIAKKRILY
ncbi:MAG: SHOCT domain-containing protein [Thermodesulfobacteriota bacterium]|nr:SHOCT domain-containing protein [Thermodesulfobacteriota bacterium]